MNVGEGVELVVGVMITVGGILMVDVDVVNVMEGSVFDVVGLVVVVGSDTIEDARYQGKHHSVRRKQVCFQVPYWWWM